jgi:hypothetical protein
MISPMTGRLGEFEFDLWCMANNFLSDFTYFGSEIWIIETPSLGNQEINTKKNILIS